MLQNLAYYAQIMLTSIPSLIVLATVRCQSTLA